MTTKVFRVLGSLFGLLLFAGALWVLYHELRAYHLHDLLRPLHDLPAQRLFIALALTVLNYLLMTSYDALALQYVRHPLSYGKIALASFVGYAFSNSMGFGMIAGGSVRYRLYSKWGLSALEITKVVVFSSLTFWLGFIALGGGVFLFEPVGLPRPLPLPFTSVRPLGVLFLVILLAYLTAGVLVKNPVRIRDWEVSPPSSGLVITQLGVAIGDWALAGAILYTLLPAAHDLSYIRFLGIFLVAQTAGLVSQVPGGLGVFETVVVVLLSPPTNPSKVFAALLAYRGIYYLLPLGVAAAMLGAREILQTRDKVLHLAHLSARWGSELVPSVLTFATFVAGTILLFSGATPEIAWRVAWLRTFLPLPLLEVSHFLGSIAGMTLLLLARGLQRRLDAAFLMSAVLLGLGIFVSLLKGLDYEEALALSVVLASLLLCRGHFYRKTSLFRQRFSPTWMLAIALVLLSTFWLGLFSYKHVEYSKEFWWHFTFFGNAPRSLRAMVGVVATALFFGVARLLQPAPAKYALPSLQDLDRISPFVERSKPTYAHLAMLGDKALLMSEQGNAFIMYRVEGRSWVAMGDPVGAQEEWPDLLWQFRELCDIHDGWTIFYEVGPRNLPLYLDFGLSLLKLGEEGRVSLYDFGLDGRARKSLRNTCNRLEQEGCTFAVMPRETVPSLLPELRNVSDAWLAEKKTREKGFSLGFFDANYLRRCPVAVVRRSEGIAAFANLWPGGEQEELSVDLMRHVPDCPRGVMDYLFVQLILWGKAEGYRWFNLGMAPLSGLEDHELAPLWSRFGAFLFRHGEHFYNFQGLRQYKEKFDPVWEPRYLAAPAGIALPRILANVSSLVSRGLKGSIAR
jgi:phosphatidylglycerol lysyltransferase